MRPQQAHHLLKLRHVLVHLLHGNEIEGGDHLGDIKQRLRQARQRIEPMPAEIADVPRGKVKTVLLVVGRDVLREPGTQRQQAINRAIARPRILPEPQPGILNHRSPHCEERKV